MTSDRFGDALFLGLALLLPLSALLARRVPLKNLLVMVGAWVGIFVVAVLAVGLSRDRISNAWSSFTNLMGNDEQHVAGRAVTLRMAPDGHFWATATINGVSRRMLIDSGATTTSLSLDTAKAAGLDLAQSPFPVPINTANGMVLARSASVTRLTLGPIEANDLRVVVAEQFGDTDVLGMNFLSRLQSWRVENRKLILVPRNP